MSQTLTRAHAEWFSRPGDERFTSISEFKDVAKTYAHIDSRVTLERAAGRLLTPVLLEG